MDDPTGGKRLASTWWLVSLRGILAVLFAVLAFVYPVSAAHVFSRIFGAYAFATGLFALIAGLRWQAPDSPRWWYTAGQGLIGAAAGAMILLDPKLGGYALALLVAAWAIASGAMEIANCRRMRARLAGEIFLGLAGLASIALGIVFLAEPKLPVLLVTIAVACYAFVNGFSLIIIGSRLRGVALTGKGLRA